ncbi:MAG: ATP-binding protein [Proteobacteria bacterium]|jgi:signal transduction histidine kinase|nr:ATP-binding protein [Pseudomonadota bacterium]
MQTKLLPLPGQTGFGLLSTLGLALLGLPARAGAGANAPACVPAPRRGAPAERDAAQQAGTHRATEVGPQDVNQVLRRMVRIARTLVPPGVRIAERYATPEQHATDMPEFHQVVLHLILDAAQALHGCGTIDVASRCTGGELFITISDSRACVPPGWGLMSPLLGAGRGDHAECSHLGLLMAGDYADEHGGRVLATRRPQGGHTVTIVLALTSPVLS